MRRPGNAGLLFSCMKSDIKRMPETVLKILNNGDNIFIDIEAIIQPDPVAGMRASG